MLRFSTGDLCSLVLPNTRITEFCGRTSMYRFHAWGNNFGQEATTKFVTLVERHPYLKDLDFIITKSDDEFRVAAVNGVV